MNTANFGLWWPSCDHPPLMVRCVSEDAKESTILIDGASSSVPLESVFNFRVIPNFNPLQLSSASGRA